jgi:hypothetical protein
MAAPRAAQNVRTTLAVLFTVFLLVNATLQTLAVIGGVRNARLLSTPFSEDTSLAVRLLLFLLGVGISWLLARTLYKFMVRGQLAVGDSTNASFVLLFYLLLIFATLAFLNAIGWFWLPALFLILLAYSAFILWSLAGAAWAAVAMFMALTAIIFTFLIVS